MAKINSFIGMLAGNATSGKLSERFKEVSQELLSDVYGDASIEMNDPSEERFERLIQALNELESKDKKLFAEFTDVLFNSNQELETVIDEIYNWVENE